MLVIARICSPFSPSFLQEVLLLVLDSLTGCYYQVRGGGGAEVSNEPHRNIKSRIQLAAASYVCFMKKLQQHIFELNLPHR